MKKVFKFFFILIVLTVVTAYATDYDYLLKAVRVIYLKGHKTAYLDDYKVFDNRVIHKSKQPEAWPLHPDYNSTQFSEATENLHEKLGTVAFLIIKNDSLWFEKYYEGYDTNSLSNSFSMAKSIVVSLLGKAIMQGHIKSLNQKVTDFFPDLPGEFSAKLTVGDLASMASGLEWDESYYSPFSVTTRAYFYDDLNNLMLGLPITSKPGEAYKYLSGNTQLLAMVIEKATGQKLSGYLTDNLWQPMGAENDALWQLDQENGTEKAYCCIASNARDFSRLGDLYLHKGNWKGQQLLDSALVEKFTQARFTESPEYGYGWWLGEHKGKRFFMMNGHLGQYVICIPEDHLIITRLGHQKEPKTENDPLNPDIYAYIDEAYRMLKKN